PDGAPRLLRGAQRPGRNAVDLPRTPPRHAVVSARHLLLSLAWRQDSTLHRSTMKPAYAELHCLSNFTFLRGASHPEELVERAAALGYAALAITDECSVAGIVRAHVAAKEHGLPLIVGSEFRLEDGLRLVLLAQDLEGYGNLCELITLARRRAPKGEYRLNREDLVIPGEDLVVPPEALVIDRKSVV